MDTKVPILIFADDGSPGADVAWLWLCSHQWHGWSIEVLHAEEASSNAHKSAAAGTPEPWHPPHARSLPTGQLGTQPVLLRATGDPRSAIRARAKTADLLVIGARGHGLLKALHIGGTADWLLRDAPAPLVIARSGRMTRRVLVCTDGSTGAQRAAVIAAGLPWIGSAEVVVVGVPESGYHPQDAVDATVQLFTGKAAHVSGAVRGPSLALAFYSVRDIILDLAKEIDADLIVVGSRGLSGWDAVLSGSVGSVSSALARHASCSVLVVPSATNR